MQAWPCRRRTTCLPARRRRAGRSRYWQPRPMRGDHARMRSATAAAGTASFAAGQGGTYASWSRLVPEGDVVALAAACCAGAGRGMPHDGHASNRVPRGAAWRRLPMAGQPPVGGRLKAARYCVRAAAGGMRQLRRRRTKHRRARAGCRWGTRQAGRRRPSSGPLPRHEGFLVGE